GAPAWQGMQNLLALAEADKEVEIGAKLKFDTQTHIELTFSWVPPTSTEKHRKGIVLPPAFGDTAYQTQGKHTPLTVIDLQIADRSKDATAEIRRSGRLSSGYFFRECFFDVANQHVMCESPR
ncbi:unnamed protein product, partial [marine sediment metagenome]